MEAIFLEAKKRLKDLIESKKESPKTLPDTEHWHEYKIGHSGYIQNISIDNLVGICEGQNTRLFITISKGLFALSNAVF